MVTNEKRDTEVCSMRSEPMLETVELRAPAGPK